VIARHKPAPSNLPGYIAIPELAVRSSTSGAYKRARTPLRGGGAGFLGPQWEPLCVNGAPGASDGIPSLSLPSDVSADRFEQRAALLSLLDRSRTGSQAATEVRDQAVHLTGSASRSGPSPFSLDDEPERIRDQYGRHRFGQAMLLARRLVEATVPMVAIHFNEMTVCDGWDTHSENFAALRTELLPMLDESLSALLKDLDERGLLDETLVVCLGEFGRTPKINANAGRDHWGECSSALVAGGGVRGGQALGESDRQAAWPVSDLVEPADIQATVYHCLGLDPRQLIYDELQRPFPISEGKVIRKLL